MIESSEKRDYLKKCYVKIRGLEKKCWEKNEG